MVFFSFGFILKGYLLGFSLPCHTFQTRHVCFSMHNRQVVAKDLVIERPPTASDWYWPSPAMVDIVNPQRLACSIYPAVITCDEGRSLK